MIDWEKRKRYHAQWKLDNPDKMRAYDQAAKKRRREWLADQKNHPCQDCGGSFPACVMDFDHRPGEEKLADVSQLAGGRGSPKAVIIAEIAKCDLICANRHRVRTWSRSQ